MQYIDIHFETIGRASGLDPKTVEHFVEGMTRGGAEDLPLERGAYTALQAVLEATVLGATSIHEVPREDAERPFTYATPKPLTPLIGSAHPRAPIAENMFRRLMGVSVMDDASFRSTVQNNPGAGRVLSLAAGRAFQHDAELFSTSVDPDAVQPPRMTMHFGDQDGPVRVAFIAEQQPSQTAGRLVFGDEATAMYEAVRAQHQSNLAEGRGAAYIYRTITGRALSKS